MKARKILSLAAAGAVIGSSFAFSLPVEGADKNALAFSDEYRSSVYYEQLVNALEDSADKTTMEKTAAAALSQEGYKNYSTNGIDIEQAKKDGLLWTGAELRNNDDKTGNTEYTRWAQRYIMDRNESAQYIDLDWCAIFVSWCLYQADYYNEEQLKKYYYSYYADPRVEFDADSWIEAFCFEQENVWYTPVSDKKLKAYDWSTYYHTDIDPYDIPYKPGGLIFFSWNGSGTYFNHVGIVIGYDEEEHILAYSNGNANGQVSTAYMDLDETEEYRGQPLLKNSSRIMAYGEYDEIRPLETKEITADVSEILWDKSAGSGLRIQTNSASKIGSVKIDGEYLGSNIESNILLREGKLSIGKSELVGLPTGKHTMMLVFDDGIIEIPVRITDVEKEKARTVMMYCIGSEAERSKGSAADNLMQAMASDDNENINFIVMTGGSEQWHLPSEYLSGAEEIDPACYQVWKLEGKKSGEDHGKMTLLRSVEISSLDGKFMNDPEVLTDFLDYCYVEYPAEQYDLIMWDHEAGTVYGFGCDTFNKEETLSLKETVQALSQSSIFRSGKHFDMIDYDAGMMGSVEVVAALGNYADYLVCSPQNVTGGSQDYSALMNALNDNPSVSGSELGKKIVDAYTAGCENGADSALSVIDTNNFRIRLLPQLKALCTVLRREAREKGEINQIYNFYDEIYSRMAACTYGTEKNYHLFDLGSLVSALGCWQTEADNLPSDEIGTRRSPYADLAAEILTILSDDDNSGDDVIYSGRADEMKILVSGYHLRSADGSVTEVRDDEQIEVFTTGLSIFFPSEDIAESCHFENVMDDLMQSLPDGESKCFLEGYTPAVVYYGLFNSFGDIVSDMTHEGNQAGDYDSLRKKLQDNGRWTGYYEKMLGYLVSCGEFDSLNDAEMFFADIVSRQSSEAVTAEKAAVKQIRTKKGSIEGYHVAASQVSGHSLVSIYSELQVAVSPDEPNVSFSTNRTAGVMDTERFRTDPSDSEALLCQRAYGSPDLTFTLSVPADTCLVVYDADSHPHIADAFYTNPEHTEAYIPVVTFKNCGLASYYLYVARTESGWQIDGLSKNIGSTDDRKYIPMNSSIFASEGMSYSTASYYGQNKLVPISSFAPVDTGSEHWGMTVSEKTPDELGLTSSRHYYMTDVYGNVVEITKNITQADIAAENGDYIVKDDGSEDPSHDPSEDPSHDPSEDPSHDPSGKESRSDSTSVTVPDNVPVTGDNSAEWLVLLTISTLCTVILVLFRTRKE